MGEHRDAPGDPRDVDDLRHAARRFRAGHWLALATALLLIVGAVAKATGAPAWLVGVLWAAMAASAALSAVWMVPTYVRFKRLSKQLGERRE
jgi:hypothetical protein